MSIKTRLEKLEAKVKPKPRPRPHKFLFRFGNAAFSMSEFEKSMEGLKQDQVQDQVFKFNFEDPAIAKDQAAKPDPQPKQEPDDNELEAEVEKLEAKKAALLDKGKKT